MSLEEKIIETIEKNLQKKVEITLDSHLQEDLMIDSFDKLMIISALEDTFSINIDEEDFMNIATVRDIVEQFKEKYV